MFKFAVPKAIFHQTLEIAEEKSKENKDIFRIAVFGR